MRFSLVLAAQLAVSVITFGLSAGAQDASKRDVEPPVKSGRVVVDAEWWRCVKAAFESELQKTVNRSEAVDNAFLVCKAEEKASFLRASEQTNTDPEKISELLQGIKPAIKRSMVKGD